MEPNNKDFNALLKNAQKQQDEQRTASAPTKSYFEQQLLEKQAESAPAKSFFTQQSVSNSQSIFVQQNANQMSFGGFQSAFANNNSPFTGFTNQQQKQEKEDDSEAEYEGSQEEESGSESEDMDGLVAEEEEPQQAFDMADYLRNRHLY